MKSTITFLSLLLGAAIFTGCEKEDPVEPEKKPKPSPTVAAKTLECDYFHVDRTLVDNPDAPVDYFIPCELSVKGVLTIEPGVVIEFGQNGGMEIEEDASFKMKGTAEKPIIITGAEKVVGYWKGIASWSNNPSNIMEYVHIEYAGGESLQYGDPGGLAVFTDGQLTMNNCTISHSESFGLNVTTDNKVILNNNVFTKNDVPLRTFARHLNMINASNSFSGNTNDHVLIMGGGVYSDATWPKIDVPYLVDAGRHNIAMNDAVLTIEAGVELIMTQESEININWESALVMIGTATDSIIVRGEHDIAGYWNHIDIESNSLLNEIAFVDFRNAGVATSDRKGAILLHREDALKIHNVVFTDCVEFGVTINTTSNYFIEYSNLSLDNTSFLFSDWDGVMITNP